MVNSIVHYYSFSAHLRRHLTNYLTRSFIIENHHLTNYLARSFIIENRHLTNCLVRLLLIENHRYFIANTSIIRTSVISNNDNRGHSGIGIIVDQGMTH
jgi:hypothetical protein